MTPWGKVCCIFGVHSLTQWRAKPRPSATSERHCKRKGCLYTETKPLRLRRAPMEADTVQPKAPHG